MQKKWKTERRGFAKQHILDTKTQKITAVSVTDGPVGDSKMFESLWARALTK